MPPARDLRRRSRAVAHAAPPGGRPRMWPLIGSDAADAASSRVGGEPAGKPAIPVSRAGAEPAGKPAIPVSRAGAEPARTGTAGFQPASRAGGSMPPARDLRRGSRAVAHAAPPGGRPRMWPLIGSDAADAASSRAGGEPAGKPAIPVSRAGGEPAGKPAIPASAARRSRAGSDWDRRLSAGFACRGLDAPGTRSAAREPGGCPCRAAGRTTAHVASDRLRRRRRGIEPRRGIERRAGWKAGDPSEPRRRRAGWKAGDPGQPRRRRAGSDWDRRLSAGFACRGLDAPGARSAAREPGGCSCRAAGRTTRMWPLIGSDAADAASSRVGGEPAGKPAIPVSRVRREPAGKPAIPVSRAAPSRLGLGPPAFSRLRVPGARCPRRAICGAGAGRLPICARSRADDGACGL
jgi:hypothetical protein